MLQINYHFHSSLKDNEKEKIKKYLDKKLNSWERFFKRSDFPSSFGVEGEFLPRKKRYRAEIQLETAIGKMISSCEKNEIMEGFDEVLEDLSRQFKRQKEKIATIRKRGGTSIKKKFTIHNGARFRKTS